MMTKLFAVLLTTLSVQAWAGTLPDGNFEGSALWKSQHSSGTYRVKTSIDKQTISTVYNLPDGSKREWSFKMEPSTGTFFKVKSQDAELGNGYCLEKAQVCHYEVSVGKLKVEETITALNGKLYRFGSKDDGSGPIMWQEAMDPK